MRNYGRVDVDGLALEYRTLVVAHADTAADELGERNRIAKEIGAIFRRLRLHPSGRNALSNLMDDPDPAVKLWAAKDCYGWDTDRATRVLENLRENPSPRTSLAEWWLKQAKMLPSLAPPSISKPRSPRSSDG